MAFNSSIITSALQSYVDQLSYNKFETQILLQGRTAKLVNVISGIKNSRTINTLTSNLVITPATCGLISPTGSVTPAQVTITVCPLQSQESICYNGVGTLEQLWTGMLLPKGSYYDSGKITPQIFAEAYLADKINKLQDANEFIVWQGDTTGATYGVVSNGQNNYSQFQSQCNGFLHQLTQTSASQSVVFYSGTASGPLVVNNSNVIVNNSAFSVVDQLAQQQVTDLSDLSDRDDLCVFMSYANYRAYMASLRNLNFFHPYGNAMENEDSVNWSFMHPGTNLRVIATSGLRGSNYILLTYSKNLFIGNDAEGEENNMQIWYSHDYNSTFVRPMWKLGTAVAFPQYCLIYTGK